VIFLILDTVRASELSVYGYNRLTSPELDRWARRGVRFEHAFSTSSWTLPSHASLFTGRQPHEIRANWLKPLGSEWPTLAEALQAAGYRTGGFVANLEYTSRESGLARGFATYRDYPISPGQVVMSSEVLRRLTGAQWVRKLVGSEERLNRKSADRVNREFLDWLDAAPGRPMFAFLNYYDAHTPYNPPGKFRTRFRTPGVPTNPFPDRQIPDSGTTYTSADVQGARDLYDAAIGYLDARIGFLLGELDRRGVLERSIVVITADHGEEFAEHGFMGHGNALYREVLEVPLLILAPGRIPEDRLVSTPISLTALPATITDLLGLPGKEIFPGSSLVRFWTPAGPNPDSLGMVLGMLRGTPGKPQWIPTGRGDMYSAVHGRSHYVVDGSGTEELYDLADVGERDNLIAHPERAGELARFRRMIETMRAESTQDGNH
jgi:arylsulfatase A-like enzyme